MSHQPSSASAPSDQEPLPKRQKAEEAIDFIVDKEEIGVKTASMRNETQQDKVAVGNISATTTTMTSNYRTESSSSNVLDMMQKYPNLLTESNYNEQAFETYLKDHDIESLKDLKQKMTFRTFGYCAKCGVNFVELEKLLKQTCEERLEDFLHQQVEIIGGGGEEELKSANARFSNEAVDVAGPTDNEDDQRKDDICLVMGPSGSGKTFYALKGLSRKKSSKGGSQDERYFTLYYKITEKENLEASDGIHTFSTSKIEKAMHASKVGKVRKKLDMRISLILDEAATAEEHIGELTNLSKIYIILSRYCTSPRLIVVGTGIDYFTSSMGSGTEVHKYRMRQWSLSNFEKALSKWLPDTHHRDDKREKLTKIVESEPMYQRLLTNARAAYFLALAVETYLYADNVQQHMPTVVTAVATKYIKSNGLCALSSSSRRRVARAVFKLLDDTSRVVEKGQSYLEWPTFATDEGNLALKGKALAMATSLIDYNVEIKDGEVTLVQGDHTVDVSPAITLVLFALVDVLGNVFSNWSGFEILVAMIEIHHLVVKQTGEDFQVRLVKLKKPFPPTVWRKNLDVPILESDCVYLNGANAPFGDVLSTGRFAQAKHKTSTEQLVLDLQDELSKMGLVNGDNNNNKACAATTALMQEWQMGSNHSINKVAQGQTPKKEKMERDTIDQARAEGTLLQQKIIEFDTYKQFRCTDKNSKVTLSHDRTTYTSDDPLPAQVEAVFYTNASQFKIKGQKRKETMIISPSDLVNHSGDLKPEKDQWVKNNIKGLRDGVCIRFVFVSQAFR
ncbi:hypothetical protein ACA910_004629 [Epithemia clementina (nom. ined.)]